MPPRDRSGPATTPARPNAADSTTSTASVQREPAPLAQAVAELLSWSDALDASLRLRLAAYRQGHEDGRQLGYDEGYTAAVAESEAAWYAAAHPVAAGIPHDELEIRRWGPGGRARAGDPRPGDYPGQAGAA
jgi:flagellar biosynthesis/type III secretory pathway protein FliH